MPTVFISYATADAQFAHRLADDLRRLGAQVWIAPESIRPGEGWVSAIERGLEESSHVVVALTPAALESRWVKKETDIAIAQERKGLIQVIPLDVEPCKVPLLLSSYQMVSFHRDYDAGFNQLADILGVRVTPPKPATLPRQTLPYSTMPEAEAAPVEDEEKPGIVKEPELVRTAVMDRRQPFEPEMVLIPASEFLMGSDPSVDKGAYSDEQPQHTLSLPDYYLAKTPLTNAQYAAFVEATGHQQPEHWEGGKPPKGKEDHPVVYVSWHDAVAYCRWLSEVTGRPYRLPSEAEWEKGARGTDGRLWPWGNQWDAERCNSEEGGKGGTTPVGAYPEGASPYGLLDMVGNVWEWTQSLWGKDWEEPSFKYPYDPDDGRENLEAKGRRVLRGGAFDLNRRPGRCAYRYSSAPYGLGRSRGFRVVLVAPGFPSGL
jgi:formylglycine-generating enzyme required for sulfatase activity